MNPPALPPPVHMCARPPSLLPRAKREALLNKAGFNVFCLRSDQVSEPWCLAGVTGGASMGLAREGPGQGWWCQRW
jgi:tryptophanase